MKKWFEKFINFLHKKREEARYRYDSLYIARANDASEEVGIDPRVVCLSDPHSHVAEQYRLLRTNIQSRFTERPLRTLLITSALRGEGKTITSANLAALFARHHDGKRVLLVDCDIRRPAVHALFRIEHYPGLSEVIRGEIDFQKVIKEKIKNRLFILPAGKYLENPAELFESNKFLDVLRMLKDHFDLIILDAPPIIPVTDAGILSPFTDATLLVVKAMVTQTPDIIKARDLLIEAKGKLTGIVLVSVENYVPYYLQRYSYMYKYV